MVYKVCKCGVRSGNTLRGLHSVKTKSYGRHAVLIGRSSLSGRGVDKLVKGSTDDTMVTDALSSTDVILSLNKRQRWLLPATLNHMITTGSFSSRAMVSLLERHKLKRRANCVSFVCNKGRLQNVKPKQKRYFSFNLDNLDDDESNRQKRKLKDYLDVTKEIGSNQKPAQEDVIKTIHTYTKAGPDEKYNKESKWRLNSTKPEYRVEVFYPCPKSCSLTFNPKYTDVQIEENEDGEQEIRPIVNNNAKAKRSRRRVKAANAQKIWADQFADVIDQDVDDMWDEIAREDYSNNECDAWFKQEEKKQQTDEKENEETVKPRDSESLLANLIAKAEKSNELNSKRGKIGKKRNRSRNISESSEKEVNKKNHVVYTSQEDLFSQAEKAREKENMSIEQKVSAPELKFSRVILSTQACSPKTLSFNYGSEYVEASCEPRRFLINITNDIREIILGTSWSAQSSLPFTSYLVFIHDGTPHNGLESFRVCLNSSAIRSGQSVEKVSRSIPSTIFSIEEIRGFVFKAVIDLKKERKIDIETLETSFVVHPRIDIINDKIKVSYEVNDPAQEIISVSSEEMGNISSSFHTVAETDDFVIFCDNCLDNINSSDSDSLPGIRIKECGHVFCDNCWQSHVHKQLEESVSRVVCPTSECGTRIGPVTLLTAAHVSEVGNLLQRQRKEEARTSPSTKSCPNPDCKRLITLTAQGDQSLAYDVQCLCGLRVCFACLGAPHWPATCSHADDYKSKLADITLLKEMDDGKEMKLSKPGQTAGPKPVEVEGKLCPKCRTFIEKSGGGHIVVCRCKHSFCWNCLESDVDNYHPQYDCRPKSDVVLKYTRKLVVHHVDSNDLDKPLDDDLLEPESEDKKKSRSRQRVSLYQKALQQRMEGQRARLGKGAMKPLATKVLHAARKDADFNKEVMSICCGETSPLAEREFTSSNHPSSTHVMTFLQSCHEMSTALHHLNEFTYVLLHNVPASTEKSRALRLAEDLSACCSHFRSVLEDGGHQDGKRAVRRLVEIQQWAERVLDSLTSSVNRLRR